MSQIQFTGALSTAVSLLLLLIVVHLIWIQREDRFRDRLFALRDELFLYAVDENLVDATAHENLRLMMNGLIRYAHRVSFGRAILLDVSRRWFGLEDYVPRLYADWLDTVDKLPVDQAARFRSYHDTALLIMTEHMMSGSPVLWLGCIVVALKHLLVHLPRLFVGNVANSLKPHVRLDLLEADALRSM